MIIKKIFPIIFFISSCAQIVSPSGGAKDEKAPVVKSTYPENKSTMFSDSKIEIKFDEYVEIKDAEQIVISPYIKEKPTIESVGKSIIIDLKKSILEKNKTYTINFGNSITDNHEGTILENYSYTFSTGTYIDSLSINGEVFNANNLKPEKGIIIGLYYLENFEDSTPMKSYPAYMGKTNEKGIFSIENLPKQKYQVFAFKDENKNLKYEKIETVAFEVNSIESNNKSNKLKLLLSEPFLYDNNKIIDTIQREPGVYSLAIYNSNKIESAKLDNKENLIKRIQNNDNQIDTLFIYTKERLDSGITIINLSIDKEVRKIPIKNRKRLKNKALEFKSNRDLSPNDTLKLYSNYPIEKIDPNTISIKGDSIAINYQISQVNSFEWNINFKKEEEKIYNIVIEDSLIKDIWNRPNKEFKSTLQIKTSKETGSLLLNIENAEKETYIIQLVTTDEKENVIKEITNNKTEQINFSYINPVELRIKIIKDSNNNGKWDRANWLEKTQAEEIGYYEQKFNIRAFWDIEQNIIPRKILNN
jgi:hypothetical protein